MVGSSLTEDEFVRHAKLKFPGTDMKANRSFDFTSFVSANADRSVSGFDYLHAIYKAQELPSDFIVWVSRLFCPEFKTVDGMVFISEMFDSEKYNELLRDGRSSSEIQFWINLLEITGMFDGISSEQAMIVAESIADSWNFKLYKEFGDAFVQARAILDDTGEVFVTIGNSD